MSFIECALFILCLLVIILSTGLYVYLFFENKERIKFKVEAKALIETHNHLMLRMTDIEKIAKEAQIGVNYLKSMTPQPRPGARV